MIESILAIVATVVGLVGFLWKRKAMKKDDPTQQNRERYKQIDQDIGSHDPLSAAHADDDLAELERLQHRQGDSGRPK